jgi:hypothetical protein
VLPITSFEDGLVNEKMVCGRFVPRHVIFLRWLDNWLQWDANGTRVRSLSNVNSWYSVCPRLRKALARVDAHAEGKNTVSWTSLREVRPEWSLFAESWLISLKEPVVYIAGKPHVLRLVDRPLENVE